jgi:hypothetical protein
MPALTISAAARLCHMDRRTLQRAIHAGRLHLDAQHCLSTDELLLAGYLLADTPQDAPQATPQETPLIPLLTRLTLAVEGLVAEVRQLRAALQQVPQRAPQDMPRGTPRSTPQEGPQYTPQATPRLSPQATPQTKRSHPASDYDPAAAYARMQALQAEGRTLAQIAATLTAEGIRTKQGRPWHKSTVSYLLKTFGR